MKQTKKIFFISILTFIFATSVFALSYTSSNYSLSKAKIVASGGNASSFNYSLKDVKIGSIIGGKASSANYSLDASNIDREIITNPPTVNPVVTPTNIPMQTLTGTKDPGTSIYINGYEAVALNSEIAWSYDYTLEEGDNYLIITSRNSHGLDSDSVLVSIFLDTSAPSLPLVTDDGAYTTSTTQLHASWISEDPQTGIVEYQYAIGTTVGGTDVVGWTQVDAQTEITHTNLTLVQGQTYYMSVQAKNAVGSWSEIGSTDGITVNQSSPVIAAIVPAQACGFHPEEVAVISVTADDSDGDSLEYQFSVDGHMKQSWSTVSTYEWNILPSETGLHTVKAEVTDNLGGLDSKSVEVYIFLPPIGLPTP